MVGQRTLVHGLASRITKTLMMCVSPPRDECEYVINEAVDLHSQKGCQQRSQIEENPLFNSPPDSIIISMSEPFPAT